MANQDIADFYNQVTNVDFGRKFQFRVLQINNTFLNADDFVYITTANLPGRQITNIPTPFMGLDFNVPGTVKYPNSAAWAVTFRCDQSYNIRTKLEDATFSVFDEKTSTGLYATPGTDSIIQIALLDKNMNFTRIYDLVGAYVVSVGESAYDLGDSGTIQTVPATLAYQYWGISPASPSNLPGSGINVGNDSWRASGGGNNPRTAVITP
jgi:hypothetical protein